MAEPLLSACAALVRKHDPDRFFTALFAPPDRRDALLTVYAFNHELARAREVASEPMLALIRLQWWREVVEGTSKRHEVASPVSDLLDRGMVGRDTLRGMIEGREMEADPSIPTVAGWTDYLIGTAGALAVAAGEVLGAGDGERDRLRNLGAAYGAAGLLRSVAALARQGRCLWPDDLLGDHGLTRDDVIADPSAPGLSGIRAELAGEARSWLAPCRGPVRREIIAAALPAVLARRDLRDPMSVRSALNTADRIAVLGAAVRSRV